MKYFIFTQLPHEQSCSESHSRQFPPSTRKKHLLAQSRRRRRKKASPDSSQVPRRAPEQAQTLSAPPRVLLTRWRKFPP